MAKRGGEIKKIIKPSVETLTPVSGKVVQARGKFNREVTAEEQVFIDKYNAKLKKRFKEAQNG